MGLCVTCGGSGRAPMPVDRILFDYAFATIALTASGNVIEQDLQLDDDAVFECVGFLLFKSPTVKGTPPASLLQLSDQSSGWQFSNAPIALQNFASSESLLFPLLVPYLWMPSAQAIVKITDEDTAQLQVVMKGYKIYPKGTAPAASPQQNQGLAA